MRRIGVIVVVVAAALMAAACGGGNNGSTSTTTEGKSASAMTNGGESQTTATTAPAGAETTGATALTTSAGAPAPLPDIGVVMPGTYTTDRFTPSFSVKIDEPGWVVRGAKSSDRLGLVREDSGAAIAFVDVTRVRDPEKPREEKVVSAPDDLVAWLQHNPYLKTRGPESTKVGGVSAKKLDASVSSLPKKGFVGCSNVCLPLFRISGEQGGFKSVNLLKGEKGQLIVLDKIDGEKVAILVFAPEDQFSEFLPKARKVLDTVEWSG